MEKRRTRRDFIRDTSLSGLGMIGFGAFMQSCAEKKIMYSQDLAKLYIENVMKIVTEIREREFNKIRQAVGAAVQAKLLGKKLYTYLTGPMIAGEMNEIRPGHPQIFTTEDISSSSREDFIFTNDADAVRGLSERMVKIAGMTSPWCPDNNTGPDTLENIGGFRIEDVADIIIYSHVPPEDGLVSVEGIDIPLFPGSGIIHTVIYYSFISDVMEELAKHGIYYSAKV